MFGYLSSGHRIHVSMDVGIRGYFSKPKGFRQKTKSCENAAVGRLRSVTVPNHTSHCPCHSSYIRVLKLHCNSTISLLSTAYSLLSTPCCILPTVYCLMSTIYFLLPTVYCLQSTLYWLLSTIYCLLPTVYCLLSVVYCLHDLAVSLHRPLLLSAIAL
jgi:hypothetical protein